LVRRSLAPRGRTPIAKVPGRKRQKISLIAALSLAPRRNRIGLYFRTFPDKHITQVEAAAFTRDLLRHLRGPVHVVWDRGTTHKGPEIRRLHEDYPRLMSHWLPPYAPELNPVEFVWNHAKYGRGANYLPRDLDELHGWLRRLLDEARGETERKRSFFNQAKLPLREQTLAG
jgi:transposase